MATVADEDALLLGIASIIVTLTWAYHWIRALRRWRHERSFPATRAAFVASMLMLSGLRIIVGSFVRAFPTVTWLSYVQLAVAPVLTLMLLSGGVLMIVLWTLEDRQRRRRHPERRVGD